MDAELNHMRIPLLSVVAAASLLNVLLNTADSFPQMRMGSFSRNE